MNLNKKNYQSIFTYLKGSYSVCLLVSNLVQFKLLNLACPCLTLLFAFLFRDLLRGRGLWRGWREWILWIIIHAELNLTMSLADAEPITDLFTALLHDFVTEVGRALGWARHLHWRLKLFLSGFRLRLVAFASDLLTQSVRAIKSVLREDIYAVFLVDSTWQLLLDLLQELW